MGGVPMRVIHRYPIDILDTPTSIAMPAKATLLHVAISKTGDGIDLWAQVETDNPPLNRSFVVKGTGHSIGSARLHYIGTAITPPDGLQRFVWHVYEVV